MCVEIPVETPAVNMYYLNDIEQLLHWRYGFVCVCVSAYTSMSIVPCRGKR